MSVGEPVAVEVVFKLEGAPDDEGRQWVTCETLGAAPVTVGYVAPRGDAVAAHGTGADWPLVDMCADPVRALGAVIEAWGAKIRNHSGGSDGGH